MDIRQEGILLDMLALLTAKQKADSHMMQCLLATHPHPKILQEIWEASAPAVIDEALDGHFRNDQLYKQKLSEALSDWAHLIQITADAARE